MYAENMSKHRKIKVSLTYFFGVPTSYFLKMIMCICLLGTLGTSWMGVVSVTFPGLGTTWAGGGGEGGGGVQGGWSGGGG